MERTERSVRFEYMLKLDYFKIYSHLCIKRDMNITQVDEDSLIDILLTLPVRTILNFCESNTDLAHICWHPLLWCGLLRRDFPGTYSIEGDPKELYMMKTQLYQRLTSVLPESWFNFTINIQMEEGEEDISVAGHLNYQNFLQVQREKVNQMSKDELIHLLNLWNSIQSLPLVMLDHRGEPSEINGLIFDSKGNLTVLSGGDDIESYAEMTGREHYFLR